MAQKAGEVGRARTWHVLVAKQESLKTWGRGTAWLTSVPAWAGESKPDLSEGHRSDSGVGQQPCGSWVASVGMEELKEAGSGKRLRDEGSGSSQGGRWGRSRHRLLMGGRRACLCAC